MSVQANYNDWDDIESFEAHVMGHDELDGRYNVAAAEGGDWTCERMDKDMSVEEMADLLNAVGDELSDELLEKAFDLLERVGNLATLDTDDDDDDQEDNSDDAQESLEIEGVEIEAGDMLEHPDGGARMKVYDVVENGVKMSRGPEMPSHWQRSDVERLIEQGYRPETDSNDNDDDDDQEPVTDGGEDDNKEISGAKALDLMGEFESEREQLESLGDELAQRDPITGTGVDGVSVGDGYELRLRVYYRPPDRGDGSPSWTVPQSLLQWGDDNGLLLRETNVLEEIEEMKAEFAPREETPHDPQQIVLEEIEGLFAAADISPAGAIDYWACDLAGESQTAWGESRGVNRQTVNDRVTKAREEIANSAEQDD